MIKEEQAEQYLAPFKPKGLKKEDFSSFSIPYQKLAGYITNTMEYRDQQRLLASFSTLGFPDKLWETQEGKSLVELLFSKVQAPYIQRIWDAIYQYSFQIYSERRPFRSKDPEDYRGKQLKALRWLYQLHTSGIGAIPVAEQFQYAVYKGGEENLFAIVLSEDPDKYYPLIEEIFLGEHEIGAVCMSIIKAALMVEDTRYHTLVEKLL